MAEQRNPYRGGRPWLRLGFRTKAGPVRRLDLLADTGCPGGLVFRPDIMDELAFLPLPTRETNFGPMAGGWVRLYTPELSVVETVIAYGNAKMAATAARSHPDFVGVVGLPILRLGEFGGNAADFWLRYPPAPTPPPASP